MYKTLEKRMVNIVEKKQKKIYFEWMRILACGLVIFNHLEGYTLYKSSIGMKQGLYMLLTMITRINVPLFFMISGALLLKKRKILLPLLRNE